ncbi:Prevent-host-death protein [Candidatus Magnetomoraceae bacterium gMMP-15]
MNMALQILGHEQFINNMQGKPEFIVLPIEAYQQLIEFIEDYGLGLAMQEAENLKRYNRETALRFLDDEN